MNKQTEEALRILIDELVRIKNIGLREFGNGLVNEVVLSIGREALAQPAQEPVAWISVKDRLPEPDIGVFGLLDGKIGIYSRYDDGEYWYWSIAENLYLRDIHDLDFESDDDYLITHWMPLPEPPKE